MFQPSTLHTDFARRLQDDRRVDIRIQRRTTGESRRRFATVTAALLRPFRGTAPVLPVAESERTAAA